MNDSMIAGAGLAGLIAAQVFQRSHIYEIATAPLQQHRALLRFRTDAVAKLTGIEFTPVTVRKGIWVQTEFVPPSIRLANMYSHKILRRYEPDRSIWNLDPVQRFIAPENLYEQLVDLAGTRIHWGTPIDFKGSNAPAIISTIPLPALLAQVDPYCWNLKFQRSPIVVARFRIEDCNLYQTIYFPDQNTGAYRASITKDLLIIESIDKQADETEVLRAFGIHPSFATEVDSGFQEYGKIVPLLREQSQAILHRLTTTHNIYSLGRFATWRNILLDDVVQDAAVIFRLMRSSNYGKALHFSKSP